MAMVNGKQCLLALLILWWGLCPASHAQTADAAGWAGNIDAAWHWRLPTTPNGLKPTQSWHAIGSTPDGDIYVAGMDHATNAALYRLEPRRGTLRYVGDARSASEGANNWLPGETAQKFHTRPLWLNGRAYVATMDRSTLNDDYLSRRGFHWYAYDIARDEFADLSVAERGGTGADHGGIVTIAADASRNVLYGAAMPTGDIYRYEILRGRTESLGRPASYDRPYVYAGRVMWVDSRGRLYFTAGNPLVGSYDPAIYGHIHFFDPVDGFGERKDWRLRDARALEVGQCLPDRRECFFSDDQGHIYRFEEGGPSWSYVGKAQTSSDRSWVWLFHVSRNGRRAYLATSSGVGAPNLSSLYEFDLSTAATRRLCGLRALSPELSGFNVHTGYDGWDAEGRFYFASFSTESEGTVVVTRLDPVRLKVALGVLPSLTEVTIDRAPKTGAMPSFLFARSGATAMRQEVLYKLVLGEPGGATHEERGTVEIPAGAGLASIALQQLSITAHEAVHGTLSILPNGDDYIAGLGHELQF
jgi:hypothetical protein